MMMMMMMMNKKKKKNEKKKKKMKIYWIFKNTIYEGRSMVSNNKKKNKLNEWINIQINKQLWEIAPEITDEEQAPTDSP
jgi:hypothetical protein